MLHRSRVGLQKWGNSLPQKPRLTPFFLRRFGKQRFFPRLLNAIGVLSSTKEGKVICEIDGWVLGGVQLRCWCCAVPELFVGLTVCARLTAVCSGCFLLRSVGVLLEVLFCVRLCFRHLRSLRVISPAGTPQPSTSFPWPKIPWFYRPGPGRSTSSR